MLTRVDLILQIVEGVVRQALLIAQRILQALHGLLALRAFATRPLRHLHVFHHLAQLIEQFLRLGGPALFHQLLQLVQHGLHLVLGDLQSLLVVGILLIGVQRLLLRQLLHIVLHRFVQLLHQLGDFLAVGTVLDRL